MLSALFRLIGELLFPSYCCYCHQFGPYLCNECYEFLHFYLFPISIVKLKIQTIYLDGMISAVEYEPVVGSLLHHLKYKHAKEVGLYLADLLYFTTILPKADLITAVPLHPKRQHERGYNQSEVIAKRLAYISKLPFSNTLVRTKMTASQASLRFQSQRFTNLRNIFAYSASKDLLIGKKVLLIDDVCTTGTTLNECAQILKKYGAEKVYGITIAHGS